jgi:adenylate kinase
MQNNPQILILLGRSGCGKGTQAKLLREKFGFEYMGSGESLREKVKTDGFSGKKIGEVTNSGSFVPVPVIFQIWINKLEEWKNSKPDLKGIIFDGSPRKLPEAMLLDESLEWYEWNKNIRVVLIDISEQEAFNRLTRRRICKNCAKLIPYIGEYKNLNVCDACSGELISRPDDKEVSIRGRLEEFTKEVLPVIEYYKQKGLLITISGDQTIEGVHESIVKAI